MMGRIRGAIIAVNDAKVKISLGWIDVHVAWWLDTLAPYYINN